MSTSKEIVLCPDFGSMQGTDGKVWVIEVLVAPGDFVMQDDTIITVESDKATMEIPAPKSGKITDVLVSVGEFITKQTPMCEMEITAISRQDFRGEEDQKFEQDFTAINKALEHMASPTREIPSNSVFLVHGHNDALREMTARFMEKLGLTVVILQEQVSRGATIIEKLERNSDVQFAVVLMTADDIGGKKDSTVESLQARARQNVILELGFFMGKIGRARVCVLYERGVELPSDYYGVVFIEIDTLGMWRYALGKELRQAGLEVDLNKL